MKLSKSIMPAVLFILTLAACGSGEYSDVKDVMNAQAGAMKNYIEAMAKAENAQDVVNAINGFTGEMKQLVPEMKMTLKKYPELSNNQTPPEALKAQTEEIRELSGKLQAATMKTMQYMQSPEVQKAMQEQGKVMMELAKE